MENKLNDKEAYEAMFIYLNNLYERTNSDDLAGYLGSMLLMEDGKPVDSAVWSDWMSAIKEVKNKDKTGTSKIDFILDQRDQ